MVRPTYVEIDLDAIAHNVRAFKDLISPSRLCTVVKADAYGHGDVPVANTALDAGADLVAVALIEEGIRLREAGMDAEILLLSEPEPESAADIVRWDLIPTIYSTPFLEALAARGESLGVHLKVDTGMHRVGAAPEDLEGLVTAVQSTPNLDLAAIWTHFPVADKDPSYTRHQIEIFDELTLGFECPATHMANTAGAVLFPEARKSLARVGLGTYGLHPCDETRDVVELRPAMRLITHVSHTQRLPAGERPSYGRVRALQQDANVATVPVGYADGYPRALTRSGHALIGGRRYPLAGTVTMDQIVIDTGDDRYERGEEVVLLGSQGDEEISAYDWAAELGTISYEVVCSIGPRVTRRYV
jgi:alanine racemase